MNRKRVSIVVPLLNEAGNLSALHERVSEVFRSKLSDCDFELFFIDDGSTDGSYAEIEILSKKDPRVKGVSFSRNFGHQIALSAGMDLADGDAVIFMDADLQHPPELLPELITQWKNGYDIVYTVRESTEKEGFFKHLTSRFFYRLFRILTGLDLPSQAADFRLLDRLVVEQFRQIRERSRFLRGLTSWVGFKTHAISYRASARTRGVTKYTLKKMLYFAFDGIVSFSTKPLYMGMILGFIFATLGFCYLIYVLYMRFFTDVSVPGWASVVSMLSLIGGIQLVVMGMMGIYIGKIYEEVKQRPLYLIRRRVG